MTWIVWLWTVMSQCVLFPLMNAALNIVQLTLLQYLRAISVAWLGLCSFASSLSDWLDAFGRGLEHSTVNIHCRHGYGPV